MPAATAKPRCETCKYFERTEHEAHCRRFPPAFVISPPGTGSPTRMPVLVLPDDWCGEFVTAKP